MAGIAASVGVDDAAASAGVDLVLPPMPQHTSTPPSLSSEAAVL